MSHLVPDPAGHPVVVRPVEGRVEVELRVGGWVGALARVGVDTPRGLGKRNEQPRAGTPPRLEPWATYLTERRSHPGSCGWAVPGSFRGLLGP